MSTRPSKLSALRNAATYRPQLGATIIGLSLCSALLEGIGVGYVLPMIEFAQSSTLSSESGGILDLFVTLYNVIGVPLTLESLVAGVVVVMTLRFTMSFLIGWLRARLDVGYKRSLRQRLFEALAYAPIEYIDEAGSDELLNTLVTETNQAGSIVSVMVTLAENALRAVIYLVIATVLSPILTLLAVLGLSASTVFVRFVLEPAYTVGDDVADANTRLQTIFQAGVQGMRDVRLFTLRTELIERLRDVLGQYFTAGVRLKRNQAALNNLNQFTNALVVFGLVYAGIRFTNLSLGELGVFLFAVFRLAPTVAQINSVAYSLNGVLPHLVRVQSRLDALDASATESSTAPEPVESIRRIEFRDVSFTYGDEEQVLRELTFDVERGEQVAFVGQSGAGKSTIVSLLGRLRKPDSGRIFANGTPIEQYDVDQWRERVAVVRQNPYIFDDTLRENVTVGNRDASFEAVERVCEVAKVTEFLPDLPEGYDTELGDEGVRLSGGQKQRVAIARALLKDADVLIFDEATSELDSHIEQAVHTGIAETKTENAVVSIAHRLSTVNDADRIYVIADGTVTEVGTHDALLENDGTYASLYAEQV